MIDSRIRANDNVVVSFENGFAPSYKLKDIRNGSFEIVFEKPLEESLSASYTVQ